MTTPVAPPLKWRRSSASAEGNCVEVAFSENILVRDSKDSEGSLLKFPAGDWNIFLHSISQRNHNSVDAP